ncbi:unnamed protein product [Tetraodon nigroviridis]|uniref:Kinesin-like protein n=1 Tax=Tetraodon nigroviridis TaxID=99883 RepID=Q4S2J7_TETNG|nr:unnamed protein product [Tetraodon nigroviridis]
MGRAFVKDLCWVQVNNAEEAYKILIFGKKNQSFSATRLNHLSSRSHSIFSIRVLRIEDVESPKVHTVSELSLCDLAGSERCAKTQNTGERLKEAGNINTSLLILGKCINAMRNNKQAKLLQHVPFRESKLTHYLQGFFCGRGKVSMIVNINQCASMYDETLNVLKLSAVAQKVVILSSKPPPIMPQKSVVEVSFVEAEKKRSVLSGTNTTNTSAGSYSSLEDVQDNSQHSFAEAVDVKKATDECLNLCRAVAEGSRGDNTEELEKKMLVLNEQMHKVQQWMAQKHGEAKNVKQEEKGMLLFELLEKATEGSHVKQLEDLQEGIEGTQEKEVLSPPHEGEAQEEASSMLDSLKKSLEAEKTARLEMITALEEAEERGEKHLNALSKERNQNKELQSALEVQREEVSRLVEEGGQREQEASKLREQINELTAKLEFSQHQATSEMKRSEELLSQLQCSQAQLTQRSIECQEKTLQVHQVEHSEITAEAFADLKKKNLDFQSEVEMLRAKISDMEASSEQKITQQENCRQEEVKMAELQKKLQEKEVLVVSLQRSLQKAQEQREEEESQAVQEARRREVERRRELLAVAHEAIAQKDEELQKKVEEINRLKKNAENDSEKVKSLTLDLQRREEDASDQREKLADYKKQVQQIQKEEQSSEQTLQLYQKACKDLEAKERVMEDMRLALTEQEETQSQMEQMLEDKHRLIQELSDEVEKLKEMSSAWNELCTEKHQAERRRWQEEKLSLIGQAKEAEDKRNQEMRKFIEDRERFNQQQRQLDLLSAQLVEKDQMMDKWRKERDTLVAALEVQLQKLLSSLAEKDKLIQQLQQPPESGDGSNQPELPHSRHETEILQPEKDHEPTTASQDKKNKSSTSLNRKTTEKKPGEKREPRASVISQSSSGGPSVLESSEISLENGRTSRFPRPELEISFSPLQPNRMALRRQGQDSAVTVKITRSTRKRKSEEMDKVRSN